MKKNVIYLCLLIWFNLAYSQNKALNFDGVDDVVTITNPLSSTTDYTVEVMALTHVENGDYNVFIQAWDSDAGRFELATKYGKLSLRTPQGFNVSTYEMPVNTYVHVVAVRKGANVKVFADGVEILSVTETFSLGSGLKLGRYFSSTTLNWRGDLDDLRLYDTAVSVTDIVNAKSCEPMITSNLVASYNFNNGVAGGVNSLDTVLVDVSGNGNDGLLKNFALNGDKSNWVESKNSDCTITLNDNALNFDGVDDMVVMSTPLSSTADYTLEVLALTHVEDGDYNVFIQAYDANAGRFELATKYGKLSLRTPQGFNVSTYEMPVNTYVHVVAVRKGDNVKLYADGVEVLSVTEVYSLGSSLRLGRYFSNTSLNWRGELDDLRLYDTAVSVVDIVSAKSCEPMINSNLVASYNFNKGVAGGVNSSDTVLVDITGNGHDGLLKNFALNEDVSNWVESSEKLSCGTLLETMEFQNRNEDFYVVPTSFNEFIKVKGIEGEVSVELYNTSGGFVLKENLKDGSQIISTSKVESGLYIVIVKKEGEILAVEKIVK